MESWSSDIKLVNDYFNRPGNIGGRKAGSYAPALSARIFSPQKRERISGYFLAPPGRHYSRRGTPGL
ncbi:hypothetical protein CCP3SC1AL1_110033 [Gammaproteobacteria bacterium]